ncbi:MAG: nucleotide exchange factor GrpE [Rhodospirillaceae bacterium]|jgi:molecular chaperone GrpE
MTENKENETEQDQETEQAPFGNAPVDENESPDQDAQVADTAESDSDGAEDIQGQPTEDLEAEVADLKDKLLRALAETENVRRRSERDKEDANKYAIASFAREMVEVRDNLRRALEAVEDDAGKDNVAIAGLIEGVEMTERTLLSTFERFEIKPIEAMHQKFDHNFHEALFEIEDTSVPSGTVVQEIQTGYKIHDRLLRPSKVGVSKGGAKAEADSEASADSEDGAGDAAVKNSAQAYEQSDPGSGAKVDKEL